MHSTTLDVLAARVHGGRSPETQTVCANSSGTAVLATKLTRPSLTPVVCSSGQELSEDGSLVTFDVGIETERAFLTLNGSNAVATISLPFIESKRSVGKSFTRSRRFGDQ